MNPGKNSVAYCGMCCKDCWLRKENIEESAGELLKKVKTSEFRQLAKGLPEMIPMLKFPLPECIIYVMIFLHW